MTQEIAQKYSYVVNTVILLMVLGLMAFFMILDVPILVIFSIPTICVYVIGYLLIYNGKLAIYVWMIYLWISIYMGLTTICLGYGFGFHLYCMSMIPVMFVTEYLSYKLKTGSMKALHISIAVSIVYLISTGYVSNIGPIYERDESAAKVLWLMNSVIVFGFLIFYTNWMLNLVKESDRKLEEMAHIDKLTGLFNRHYMMELLEGHTIAEIKNSTADSRKSVADNRKSILENIKTTSDNKKSTSDVNDTLAMADIDHFKQINDTYGHNAGDYCLTKLAKILKESSSEVTVGRWGGEEFLIYMPAKSMDADATAKGNDKDFFEKLRKNVENTVFTYEGATIKVTITIGVAKRGSHISIDKWINQADENLYIGKNNGRNKVVG